MKNEKRFKLGDNITYKSKNDCVDEYGDKGRYHYDGDDQDGFVGEVLKYDYYKQPTTSELFPIY